MAQTYHLGIDCSKFKAFGVILDSDSNIYGAPMILDAPEKNDIDRGYKLFEFNVRLFIRVTWISIRW